MKTAYSQYGQNALGASPSRLTQLALWSAFLVLFATANALATSPKLLDGLVAHLRFEGTLEDSSGAGNHGSFGGTVDFESGRVANAAFRTPTSQGGNFVSLGNPTGLQFGIDTDFTIAIWFRPDSSVGEWHVVVSQALGDANKQGIAIAAGAGGGVGAYAVSLKPAGRPQVNLVQSPQTWNPGQWRHLAVSVRRQLSARFFIDGVLVTTASLAGSDGDLNPASGRNLNLFQDGSGAAPKASGAAIDDLGIWRRALSDEEIGQIHACGSDGTHLGLAGPTCNSTPRGGSLDSFFNPGTGPGNGSTGALLFQPDGKLLVGGRFRMFDGISSDHVIRLMPDGTVDPTFRGPDMDIEASVIQFCLQGDGKILFVGRYTGVTRLLANGSEDSQFDDASWKLWRTIDFWTKEGATISAVAVQTDGKILAAGDIDTADRTPVRGMVRLLPDGKLDTRFLPDAKYVQRIIPSSKGIYVFGLFSSINGQKRQGLARLSYDGSIDSTYNRSGGGPMRSSGFSSIRDAIVLPDGSAIVAGVAGDGGTHQFGGLARYTPDGEWDPSFAPKFAGGQATVYSMALAPGAQLVVGGHFDTVDGRNMGRVVRLSMDGRVDPEFRTELRSGSNDYADAVAVRCDGMVAVAGPFAFIGGAPRAQVAQFHPDDPRFARLCPPTVQSDGMMTVAAGVQPGKKYRLESTADLKTWASEQTSEVESSLHFWSFRPLAARAGGFYRLVDGTTPIDGTNPIDGELTVPANMVAIPPGTFAMGSSASEPDSFSEAAISVTISRGFWLGKHEVTQREYQEIMGVNPSYFRDHMELPVEQVSWEEAMAFCGKLTAQERGAGHLPAGYEYRLPTQAQWEYACRAGTITPTAFGNSLSSTQANFIGTAPYNGGILGPDLGRTAKVGSYVPNAWGLYDMHGNVWELCLDSLGAGGGDWTNLYPGGSVTDPAGFSGETKIIRGGSWATAGQSCRSARRLGTDLSRRWYDIGFRVALVQVP